MTPAKPNAATKGKAGAEGTAGDTQDSLRELSSVLTSIARQTHSLRLYREMGARAGLDVRPYLFSVLARIRDLQPLRVSDLAEVLDYDRSTVSRQVADLTALGCIQRGADPKDGRVVVLRLTPEGEEIIDRVWVAWIETLSQMVGDWSARDRDQLVTLLGRLDAALAESFGPMAGPFSGSR